MLREKEKKFEFTCGKMHLSATDKDTVCLRLNLQSAKAKHGDLFLRIPFEPLITCNMRLDSGDKFARAERLDNVIVCAESKRANLIHVLKTRRYHQNGDVERLAHVAADGKAVRPWQHDIEQEKTIVSAQCQAFALIPIRRNIHSKASHFQIIALQFRNIHIILYEQYFLHLIPSCFKVGSKRTMRKPPSGDASACTLPPNTVTICRTMASPRPLPAATFVRAASVR